MKEAIDRAVIDAKQVRRASTSSRAAISGNGRVLATVLTNSRYRG